MNNAERDRGTVETRLRVRYAETDAMGIVYHANYFVWMEIGRTDYFRAIGCCYRELEREYQLFTPLVEVSCRYLASASYDDEIAVYTRVLEFNKWLIKFSYQIRRITDGRLLAKGESTHLVVNAERQRTSLPESVLSALRQYLAN
ncbi:MAG: thioesterase family protein [Acidobacteriota bacterium]